VSPVMSGANQHGRQMAPRPEPGTTGTWIYRIRLRGHLGRGMFDAFAPLTVSTCRGYTTLRGPIPDQAALYGVLAMIQNLGLELLEVRRLPAPGPGSDGPGD
jgi:hypothetical protein